MSRLAIGLFRRSGPNCAEETSRQTGSAWSQDNRNAPCCDPDRSGAAVESFADWATLHESRALWPGRPMHLMNLFGIIDSRRSWFVLSSASETPTGKQHSPACRAPRSARRSAGRTAPSPSAVGLPGAWTTLAQSKPFPPLIPASARTGSCR